MIKSDQSSPGKLAKFSAGKISLCAGMIALSCVLVFLFVPNAWLDGFLKNQITRALRGAYPAYSIQIAEMHYNSLKNRLECDSIRIMKNDSTVSFTVSRLSVSGFDRTNLFLGRSFTLDELKSSQADIEDILVTFNQSEY